MANNKHTAMILAAGLGTRLQTLTQNRPKALVMLNDKPLLQHVIENLIRNGFHHIVINVHHFARQIMDFIATHPFDADIVISDESALLLDTGGGIVNAAPFFKDSDCVLVHNVDILSNVELHTLTESFQKSNDDAWLLTQQRNSTRKLLFNGDGLLCGWKHAAENRFKWVNESIEEYNELSFSGIHLFKPDLFSHYQVRPASVIDLYLDLAKRKVIRSKEIHPNYWYDLGKPEQLTDAAALLNTLPK